MESIDITSDNKYYICMIMYVVKYVRMFGMRAKIDSSKIIARAEIRFVRDFYCIVGDIYCFKSKQFLWNF